MYRLYCLFCLLLFLVACGGPQRSTPAPVESRTLDNNQAIATKTTPPAPAPVLGSPNTQVYAYRPPAAVIQEPRSPSAVQLLLHRAAAQQQAGDYAAAAVSLERGLRIEPRNAQLWYSLAAVRAQQKRYAEVEQFAAKSNALAGQDALLKRKNWQLIAQARAARGDAGGAAKARQAIE